MSGKAKIAIAAAAVVVAVPTAGVLAHGLGTDSRPGQAQLPGTATARAHVVGAGPGMVDAKAGASAKTSRHGVGLAYLQTKGQTVPDGRSSLKVGPTPKHCRAINGYYFIPHQRHTDIASEGDSLAGYRHWIFYRNNHTHKATKHVVYGVVCIRGAKLIG
jgi:hypothetical protein